ncbi:udp-glycosyltransferase 76f1 [Quercus suber]|uniref:Udp-glycosyltransferase 76f1 n=1 Tax=Quercus suber TaxID=58331 RepID=A0AAW0JMK0_QUESU
MDKLLSDVSEEPISCLISDSLFYFTQAVAENLKLPRVVLRTGGLPSFVDFAAFPLLRERGYLPIQVKDLPAINTVDPDSYYEIVVGVVNESKASSGIIWNSFEELEQSELDTLRQEFPIPIFPIGPFHKYNLTSSSSSLLTQDQSSISWLDKQAPKSVIYASFGSLAALSESQFLEIAWGLAHSNQPFLWVVRPGLVRGSEWLEPLPSEELRDRISKLKEKAKFCLQQGGSSLQNLDSLVSHISKLESFIFQSQ